jgi:GrpB-like predicted nucleotidyltransferase (UPF0157 family)
MVEVVLVDYSDEWPERFERLRDRIAAGLGEDARQIEHVGSTSVPGLMAKPVIDIVLVVADTTDEDAYVPALEHIGFEFRLREPDWFEHRLLRHEEPAANLHVFPDGCDEVTRMIAFRDHLRTDAADRTLYECAKRDLARREWPTVQHYADAKTDVIAGIVARAMARRPGGDSASHR